VCNLIGLFLFLAQPKRSTLSGNLLPVPARQQYQYHCPVSEQSQSPPTFLFSDRPALEKYRLSSMKPVEFTARDGMKIYGYLTTPEGMQPKNLPMVVFVHGGSS
jgi:hypothetical protein